MFDRMNAKMTATSNKPNIVIVGAGITGLITALRAYSEYSVKIVDSGPDPRIKTHTQGATYSGMNARHISLTETLPWTYEHRNELIAKNVRDGGWMCIPEGDLNDLEKQWVKEFQEQTQDAAKHDLSTNEVIRLNTSGVNGWQDLIRQFGFIEPISQNNDMPILGRSRDVLREEFEFDHLVYKNSVHYEDGLLPEALKPFQSHLNELGGIGYYTTFG